MDGGALADALVSHEAGLGGRCTVHCTSMSRVWHVTPFVFETLEEQLTDCQLDGDPRTLIC